MAEIVYKILRTAEWEEAKRVGRHRGSRDDLRDGFIHLSAAGQVARTLAKHFAGEHGLLLAAVRAEALGEALKWEPSRGGAMFPHLYGELPVSQVLWVRELTLEDGSHRLPDLGHAR